MAGSSSDGQQKLTSAEKGNYLIKKIFFRKKQVGKLPLTRFCVKSFNPFAGKAGRGGCKNRKKEDSTPNPKPAKKSSAAHKTASLLELNSGDEELGQEKPLVTNKYLKFANVQRDDVRSVLDSKSLLSKEANMLSQELDKLILYSGTQQTLERHCSLTIASQ